MVCLKPTEFAAIAPKFLVNLLSRSHTKQLNIKRSVHIRKNTYSFVNDASR